MDMLAISVGIGLAVSLLFSEVFAIAAGGMIVPGYIALSLGKPFDVVVTLAAALATFAIVRLASSFIIVFGRRRTVAMILVGYGVGVLFRWALSSMITPSGDHVNVIGFIIPGLIAIWLDRQGVVETIASMVTASVTVRLILIAFVGMELGG